MSKRTRVPVRVRRVPSAYEIMRDPYGRRTVSPPERVRMPIRAPAGPARAQEVPGHAPEPAPRAAARPKAEPAEARAAKLRADGHAADAAAPERGDTGAEQAFDENAAPKAAASESVDEWRDRAQRLQAEIENFRKRQQRLTQERIRDDRERLLRAFLSVSDDLERALDTDGNDGIGAERLREGVELTHHSFIQLLEREGVEPIDALGQPFDPVLHDGIATVPHEQTGLDPNTVAKVVATGYRIGDRLLRPARVIVAA